MNASLKDKSVRYLASCVNELIERQDDRGRFWPDVGFRAKTPTDFQQFGYYPLALLYKLDHPANPHCGDERLLRAAALSGDNNVDSQNDSGDFLAEGWDSAATYHAGNWRGFSFLRMWQLLREDLDADRARRWEQALGRACESLIRSARQQYSEGRFCREHNVRNHPTWHLLAAYALCEQFGRQEESAEMAEQLERVCAAQHPAGCWLEHDGPVCVYQHITMSALSHYHHLTGSPAAGEALRKSADFYRLMYYPNAHPVGILDGRVRYTGYPVPILPAAWAELPQGRAHLHRSLDALLDHGIGGGHEVHGGWLGQQFHAQFLADLPDEDPGETPADGLPGDGYHALPHMPVAISRAGDWTVAGSAFTRPAQPENRWTLDYQSHVSVFHKSVGVIAGGGGGKRQAALSSFTSGTRPLGLPLLATGGSVEPFGNAGVRISLDYSGFRGVIEATIDADAVELHVSIEPGDAFRGPCFFQLPMLMKGTTAARTGAGHELPTDMLTELAGERLGGSLALQGRGSVEGVDHAILNYLPYNTHRRDGRYTPDKRLAVVTAEVHADRPRVLKIQVSV